MKKIMTILLLLTMLLSSCTQMSVNKNEKDIINSYNIPAIALINAIEDDAAASIHKLTEYYTLDNNANYWVFSITKDLDFSIIDSDITSGEIVLKKGSSFTYNFNPGKDNVYKLKLSGKKLSILHTFGYIETHKSITGKPIDITKIIYNDEYKAVSESLIKLSHSSNFDKLLLNNNINRLDNAARIFIEKLEKDCASSSPTLKNDYYSIKKPSMVELSIEIIKDLPYNVLDSTTGTANIVLKKDSILNYKLSPSDKSSNVYILDFNVSDWSLKKIKYVEPKEDNNVLLAPTYFSINDVDSAFTSDIPKIVHNNKFKNSFMPSSP